ncbi:MAG: radical SAM/SPASM domain-containing protein, partial [Bacillota bacterium]|nr:radical SAM/SPASM domain-containing protein [Bacillota bacterium]
RENYEDLPAVLEMVEREGIPRFCMYHLVYSGRGREMLDRDTSLEQKRETMRYLVEKTLELHRRGVQVEILTTDNHADGVYLYQYIRKHHPERADEVLQLLHMHGGCSAGVKMSNVDPRGDVHACQFWGHRTLGNVRERRFSEIWLDARNEFLQALRHKERHLKGRCGSASTTRSAAAAGSGPRW